MWVSLWLTSISAVGQALTGDRDAASSTELLPPPQDRIILGSNSAYLYVGFPVERSSGEDWSRFDYDFFQLERATAEGVSVHWLGE